MPDESLRPFDLKFEIPHSAGELTSQVTTPSGKKETPVIVDNDDGTISVQYQPHETGNHEMAIFHNGEHIAGWCDVTISKTRILLCCLNLNSNKPIKVLCEVLLFF